MNRTDFQTLAEIRLAEAKALLDAGFPEGAYYLAGYVLECALKACIAKRTQPHDFPDKKFANDIHTHDLGKLLTYAGLDRELKEELKNNSRMDSGWGFLQEWSESSRYDLFTGNTDAKMKLAQLMIHAIESEKGGLFPWIKQRW